MTIKKQHLQLAIGALVVAVAWSAWSYSRGSGRPAPLAPGGDGQPPLLGPDQPGPARSSVPSVDPASISAPPSVQGATESASSRDPFLFGGEAREVATLVAVGPDPLVRAILSAPSRRLAIVDNRVVGVGDQVGDFKVVRIERDAVTFKTPSGWPIRVSIRGPGRGGAGR
jgi:hypothetical protein